MNIVKVEDTGAQFNVRPGTLDEYVVKECYGKMYFDEYIKYRPEDVVLDVGANIGAYSVRVSKHVTAVHSYEASPENYEVALKNIELNSARNVHLHNLALVGTDVKTLDFFLNTGKNKGAHSLLVKRGREKQTVNAYRFSKALQESKATMVKMDIEGGEWDIFSNDTIDWTGVRGFVFEWHHAILRDKTYEKRKWLEEYLKKHFDNVIMPQKLNSSWTILVRATKN